ncbi:MAG: hypothetical protein NZ914_13270 [Gemmatales bacterium]|nr:hypothetical protein [Gemmatales bacterium]
MWDWLVDEPTRAYWVPASVAILLLLLTAYTQRAVYLLGVLALAAVMGLVALADYLVVTDREHVVHLVQDIVAAAQQQHADGILNHVADDFRSGPIDRALLARELHQHLPRVTRVRPGKLVVEKASDSSGFLAQLNIAFTGTYDGQVGESAPLLIEMRFRRSPNGRYQMYTAEVFDALGKIRYWPR